MQETIIIIIMVMEIKIIIKVMGQSQIENMTVSTFFIAEFTIQK